MAHNEGIQQQSSYLPQDGNLLRAHAGNLVDADDLICVVNCTLHGVSASPGAVNQAVCELWSQVHLRQMIGRVTVYFFRAITPQRSNV